MTGREAFAEAVLGRLRLVLQKHDRERDARALLARRTEELQALDRIPAELPRLQGARLLAKLAAEEQLAHANAMLDAALLEIADYLFDTFHQEPTS